MENDYIRASIAELRRGSTLSLGMILVGVVFLAATVYYSATRLAPLEQQIRVKQEEIAQLEAKRVELARLAAAADSAARPARPSKSELEGWVYVGRVSDAGHWAPQSDRVESPRIPSDIAVGSIVTVRSNASLVGKIDSTSSSEGVNTTSTSPPEFFIRPGTRLKVLSVRAQESKGGGKFLWVNVRVGSEDLLQVGR